MPSSHHRGSGTRWALGAYRLLLFLLPADFRTAHGREMSAILRDRLSDARSPWESISIYLGAVLDVVTTSLLERWAQQGGGMRPAAEPGPSGPAGAPLHPPHHHGRADSLWKDLRFAVRTLRRSPGFTVMAVLTLGLGIGGTTVAFSLLNGVLLRPLPFPDDQSLVFLQERHTSGEELKLSFPNFDDWRRAARSFQGIAAIRFAEEVTLLGGTEPTRGTMVAVSREFFTVLGVQPLLGRAIAPDENRRGGPPVAVVSHEFWTRVLGAGEDLSSLSVALSNTTYDVVGVMPPGFKVLEEADIYTPLEQNPFEVRSSSNYRGIGRLSPGATLQSAQVEMDEIVRNLLEAHPDDNFTVAAVLTPLREEVLGPATQPLSLLMGAAVLLLLLACSNVASTLLARATRRQREMAVRTAIGAGRGRLIQLVLVESLVIAGLAGLLGVGTSRFALGLLARKGADLLPRLDTVGLDLPVLFFAVGTTLVTAVLFGLLPALRVPEASAALGKPQTGAGGQKERWAWNVLVGGQVALAVVLVVPTSLLVRSLQEFVSSDTHFTAEGVLTVALDFSATDYASYEERGEDIRALEEALEALPTVTAVGFVNHLPTQPTSMSGAIYEPPLPAEGMPAVLLQEVAWRVADADYFTAMGIPILGGRTFDSRDTPGSTPVIVLNASAAAGLYPDQDPLGKRVTFDPFWQDVELEVIGVVAEARDWRVPAGHQPEGFVYWPQKISHTRYLTAVLHTTGDPTLLANPVRERLRALLPTVPGTVNTLESLVSDSFKERSFTLSVLGGFAILSLLLAAVGIYGVVAYTVSSRTREMGIRLALGAGPALLRRRIFASSTMVVLCGAVAGVVLSLALGQAMQSLLFEVGPRDPVSLVSAPVILMLVAAVAIWIPVVRHTRVDPTTTMRAE